MKLNQITLALLVLGTLSGCGSDNDRKTPADPIQPQQPAMAKTSGLLLDDPISGALVCLDKNANCACDEDEPSATTDAEGKYTIEHLATDKDKHPLVAEIAENNVNVAFDEPVNVNVNFMAPAGSEVISPFSTFVQHHIEDGMTKEQAITHVKDMLNLEIDPLSDFYTASKSIDELIQQKNIDALLMSRTLVAGMTHQRDLYRETLKEVLAEHLIRPTLMAATLRNLENNMDKLHREKEAYKHQKEIAPIKAEHLTAATRAAIKFEPEELIAFTKLHDAQKQKTASNPAKLFTEDGFISLHNKQDDDKLLPAYRNVKYDTIAKDIKATQYDWSDGSFVGNNINYDSKIALLDNETEEWQIATKKWEKSKIDVVTETLKLANSDVDSIAFDVEAKEYPLDDVPVIASLIDNPVKPWKEISAADELFEPESKFIDVKATATNEYYIIKHQDGCSKIYTDENKRYIDDNEALCNIVEKHSGSGKVLADDLDSLVVAKHLENPKAADIEGPVIAWNQSKMLIAELAKGSDANSGTVKFYAKDKAYDKDDASKMKDQLQLLGESTWEMKTVSDKKLCHITVPKHVQHFSPEQKLNDHVALTELNDAVRMAHHVHKGQEVDIFEHNELYNWTAMSNILANADYDKLARDDTHHHKHHEHKRCYFDDSMMESATSLQPIRDANYANLKTKDEFVSVMNNCVPYGQDATDIQASTMENKELTQYDEHGNVLTKITVNSGTDASITFGENVFGAPFTYNAEWKMEDGFFVLSFNYYESEVKHTLHMKMVERDDDNSLYSMKWMYSNSELDKELEKKEISKGKKAVMSAVYHVKDISSDD